MKISPLDHLQLIRDPVQLGVFRCMGAYGLGGSSRCRHGTVADRMAKEIASSHGSKVVDLANWREGRKMALEVGLGGEGPIPAKFADHDPCHGIYALPRNIASLISESMSPMKEAKGFARITGGVEDEYMPSGPPMSPLTVSYFTMWALFDVRFESSRETMGSCILRIAAEFDCPSWLIGTVGLMQRSRMGLYIHCGKPFGSRGTEHARLLLE